jgi:hypothetical protein
LALWGCELARRQLRDFAERLPEFPVGPADRAADLRQALRTEDQQRDEPNDDELCPMYSHGLSSFCSALPMDEWKYSPKRSIPEGIKRRDA